MSAAHASHVFAGGAVDLVFIHVEYQSVLKDLVLVSEYVRA